MPSRRQANEATGFRISLSFPNPLFRRTQLRIAVPGVQGLFGLVPKGLLHVADIQVMIADLVVLLQAAGQGNAAVSRNLDRASLDFGELDVVDGRLVRIAPGAAAATENRICDLRTRRRQNR